ncbi:MAG TPA: hypothetical protein VFQ61_27845 [Polyangiaceae bacterium]|nr:hypothetical protein [Polyangiaceae bacterium]
MATQCLSLLSAFELPWRSARHQLSFEHAEASEERAAQHGLLVRDADDPNRQRFRAFVELDCFVYPYTSLPVLGAVGGFNQWLYFLDDQYDDHPETHGDLTGIRRIMQRAYELLAGTSAAPAKTPFEQFTRALRLDLLALAPTGFMPRFLENVHDYLFDGSLEAIAHWARAETLPLEDYIELRALDSGVYPVIDCIEIAGGLRLSADVLRHDSVRQLVRCAVRHVALANDIFSYEKEVLLNGSTMNLVHVVSEREGRTLDSAVGRAVEIVNGFARDFIQAERHLPKLSPAQDLALRVFAHGMHAWMRGNVDFSLQSRRFRSGTSPIRELRESEPLALLG